MPGPQKQYRERLWLRLSAEQKERLARLAEREGTNSNEMLRRLIDREAAVRLAAPKPYAAPSTS